MSQLKVTFNRNVKLGIDSYRKGESATVSEDECGELMESGVIDSDFERLVKEPKSIDKMTVPELKEYATENNVDLGEAKKRDEILEVIQAREVEKQEG